MLGQLSAALAHELNQPLGAILRNAEAASMMLESPSVDLAELRAIVADIRKDDQRAGEVIDRLRALLGRHSMELLPVALDGLFQDVNALVRADAAARHVTLDFSVAPGLPLALGDRVHLLQVLLNLVINGMDAAGESPEAGRIVAVKAQLGQDGLIEVSVVDSGPGVAPALASRLFDSFFTTKTQGMGMGLAVSRTIVEAHGGKLWVDADVKSGATFRFTLRAA
jgi:C4-dicarboxylate-specific signal transduction histidine kinase